jgi:hypothetical protein
LSIENKPRKHSYNVEEKEACSVLRNVFFECNEAIPVLETRNDDINAEENVHAQLNIVEGVREVVEDKDEGSHQHGSKSKDIDENIPEYGDW